MFFRIEDPIADLQLWFTDKDSLQFNYETPHPISVNIRRPSLEEIENRGYDSSNAVCTAIAEREPSEKIRAMFECLYENRLPTEAAAKWDDFTREASGFFDSEGKIKKWLSVDLEWMPQSFQSFIKQVHAELLDYASRTIRVLRWRCGERGHHDPFIRNFVLVEWSFDGASWKTIQVSILEIVDSSGFLSVSDDIQREVTEFVSAGKTEPIGYELYLEASRQRGENLRSALILGIAAAESGTKHYISSLIPDSRWLVENIPSPPLTKIIEEYIPKLPAKCSIEGKVVSPSKDVIDALKKGVNLRNKLSHVGTAKITYETVQDVLLAVRDLLWILDYYSGYDWALSYVRTEVVNAMKAEALK